jgi:hypothetical protein
VSKLVTVLQIVKTRRLGTHQFNHSVKPRSLMGPIFSWMMRVGTLFNIFLNFTDFCTRHLIFVYCSHVFLRSACTTHPFRVDFIAVRYVVSGANYEAYVRFSVPCLSFDAFRRNNLPFCDSFVKTVYLYITFLYFR